MIRIDATENSVVVVCTVCGWRTMTGTRSAAWSAGHHHDRAAHDGPANSNAARNALRSV